MVSHSVPSSPEVYFWPFPFNAFVFNASSEILRLYMGLTSSPTESSWAVSEDGGASQVLWEILLQVSAHDVALKSVRVWENWIRTEWANYCFLWNCQQP